MLEQRQLLTNPAITAVPTVFFTANAEIFPYGQNTISNGTAVVNVAVVDPDASPDNYTAGNMTITSGNTDVNQNGQPAFRVVNVGGVDQIQVNDTRDLYLYSGVTSFSLGVTATDGSNATGTAVITINLTTPTNQRPVIPQYGYGAINNIPNGVVNVLEIKENSFTGTVVGTVTAIDPDAGDQGSLTYAFVGTVPGFNSSTPAFSIDPFTGKITVKDPTFLDYEARRQNLNSVVGDLGEGGLPGFADVVFDLQVAVTDNRGIFSLTSRTDQDGNSGTTNDISASHVYIRLRDVGETPPNVTNSTKSMNVNENSPAGLSVGFFELINGTPNFVVGPPRNSRTGLDPTEPQQSHSFAIVGGNPNNAFAIDYTTGEVTVIGSINFEALNVYNLQIAVTDQNNAAVALGRVNNVAPLTTIATLNITVNDINEQTAIPSGQSFSIPENTLNGTVVGTVVATDPDTQKPNGQASLVYKIISGNTVKVNGTDYPVSQPDPGVGVFVIDPDTGVISVNNQTLLAQSVALNYENQPSFSLTVQVIDRNDPSTSANATVIINLSNVNETPPSLSDTTFTIAENRALNTLVGKITAAVGEIGNTISSYQITAGNINGAFAISNSGNITVANPAMINFETNPQFVLTVKATDNGNPALFTTGKITIDVTNLNEQIVMLDQSFTLNENTPNGTVIGQLITTDPDNQVSPIQGTRFVINSGNTGGAFAIDDQGRVSVNNVSAVNFEVNPSFSIIVTVNDTGVTAVPTTSTAATITVSLLNINDAPVIGNQAFNIKEHSLANTVVGTVAASDADLPAQKLTYAITAGDPTGAFVIDPNTGAIRVTDPHLIDYNTNPIFNLTVQVTDNGSPSLSSSATVQILLQSVSAPKITNDSVTIPENTSNQTSVYNVVAAGGVGPYTYSIISGNTNNAFTISPGSGQITVNDVTQLNYESVKKFDLKVLVTDSQATPLGDTATITVNLSNVNEAPILTGIEGSALIWTENNVGQYGSNLVTAITGSIVVTDTDGGSQNMSSATVQITGNYVQGEDVLSFTPVGNITGQWNAVTGKLTLSGLDSQANYTTALRSVAYTDTADAPNTAKRTVTFQVFDDGTDGVNVPGSPLPSNSATRDIQINPTNDSPTLSGIEPSILTWVENTPPNYVANNVTATTSTITIGDPDSVNLSGATVQITGNYQSTEDQLVFANTAKITGVFDATTGKLTLTGTDTLANYITALRSVGYTDTSNAPNLSKRTLTYQVTDDGALTSNTVTRDINLTPVNDPPTLTNIELSALTWAENTPPNYVSNNVVPATATLVAGDPDSTILTGATVQITGNYQSAEDRLIFVNTANITGTFDTVSGILTLAGTDTLANYTAALRSVSYTDLSNAPNTSKRTLTYQVTDDGSLLSNTVTRDILIAPVNDPPTLASIEGSALDWIENTPPNYVSNNVTPATATLVAGDQDSTVLTGATIQITGNYNSSQDKLVFVNTGTISGTFDSSTGKLTLTGTDTLANYTAALRSVAYTNTSDAPNTLKRTLTYQVSDDGPLTSNTVTRDINVVPVNDPPTLASIEAGALNWIENTAPNFGSNNVTPVTGTLVTGDPDSTVLSGATIQITGNYQSSEDQLIFTNTGTISGVFDSTTGKLTLTGTDTLANYTAALRSVAFTDTSDTPKTVTRTLTYQVQDDGALLSNTVSRDIIVTPVNDPPTLSGIEGSALNWIENTPPNYASNNVTATTATLATGDPDSTVLTGATVQITGNYQSSEDQLVFTNTGTISGVFNPATGRLTLTGTDTLANYTAALRSVAYTNTSNAPNTLKRTLTYQVSDDGPLLSNSVTRDISITPVNDPPTLSGIEGTALTWAENTPPNYASNNVTSATATLVTGDPDSTVLTGATVQITGNYQSAEDRLVFVDTPNITGTFDIASGKLTLTGTDTLANYTAALRSVGYTDLSDAPNTLKRTLTYQVTDDGPLPSNTVTRDVVIAPVNDPPTLTGIEGSALNWIENTPPNYASNNVNSTTATLVAGDPDSTVLTGATVQITGNFQSSEDQLIFTNTSTITGVFDSTTGKLTLTGTDTLANYTAALRSVAYTDTSNTPNILKRTLTYQVSDDGPLLSNKVTRDINITPVNDPPVLSSLEPTNLTYVENGSQPVTGTILVTDPDSSNASSATVQISANYINGEDTLVFTNTANISGSFNPSTGILTLTGVDTLSNYRAALRSVNYVNLSDNPGTAVRTLTFQIKDDNDLASATVSRGITIVPVNDAPVLTAPVQFLNYTEGTGAQIINSTIGVYDVDSPTLIGATITLSNYLSNQDVLGFVNDGSTMGNITVGSNLGGVLQLTSAGGTATQAQWQAALNAVTYTNTSQNPSTVLRTATFVVNDGGPVSNLSNGVITTITVIPVNNAPTLSNPSNVIYTENDAPLAIDPVIAISDPDNTTFLTGTVTITNFVVAEDEISFVNDGLTMGNISIQSNSNGKLVLVSVGGTANTAQWQAAFAAVTYYNSSDNPSNATRSVTFTLYDGQDTSNVLTSTVEVVPVNDRPFLTGIETIPLQYVENTAPSFSTNNTVTISPLVLANDPDSVLTGAVIQITANYVAGQDFLVFKNTANIVGSYNTLTGTLTLVGTDTVANYTTALNSIGYFNRSDNPSTATRTVSFAVIDDGGPSGTPKLTSLAVTRDITVIAVNDPPVLIKADAAALSYTEDAPPLAIMPNLNVTDADSSNISSATIQITGNYNANGSQDTLSFVNTAKIKGTWDPATGILTLTGSDTLSNYRTALRSVAFSNVNDPVTALPRTVAFRVIDDTSTVSNVISRDINITTVPDAAILSAVELTTKVYKALDPFTPATPVTSSIVVTDYDSQNQISAVIQISNNYVRGQDQLVIDQGILTANQLSASWDDIAGKLTLTGIAPQANYQNALRAVKYVNSSATSAALNTSTRTISFLVIDDTAGTPLASNVVTRDVSINPNNIVPSLAAGSSGALPYTEKDPPTNVAPNLTITDADSPNMNGATIKITGNYQFPEDQLVFTNIGPIKGSWNSSNGTLTLTGLDSLEDYQAALQSVKYVNTNNNPSTLKRTVSFLVNDGLATSNAVTRDISVTPVNDPPVIKTNVNLALVYAANSGAVAIAPALTVTDPDSVNISSARVAITFNYQRGLDVLSFTNTSKITGIFDAATGVLTLTGADSLTNYRAALQSVAYTFTSTPIGGKKTIAFSAFDGNDTSVTVPGISTRDIVFSNPPVVNPNTPSLSYPTGNVDAAIAPGLTITDPDSSQLASAVVQITAGYVSGTDILSFTDTAKIKGSFDPASGKLTLTGLDTVSNYRSALRSVTYRSVGTPGGQPRTISFSAYDGSATSNVANVAVIFNSAPPLLNANVSSFRYPTANTPVSIAPQLTVTDPDSNFLASATVKITAGYVNGVDTLSFQNTGPISGAFDAATGTLTLTGTDSVSNYRSALRSVQYTFVGTPADQAKTITFSTSDGIATSNLSRVTVYVSNAPATVSTNAATPLQVTSSPVVIAAALTVTDPGSDFIQSATVKITNYESGLDSLLFTDRAKIKGSFDSSTGILTLTGLDTVGAYREALRTVRYAFTGSPLSPKTISFQVNDGFSDSNVATRDLSFPTVT